MFSALRLLEKSPVLSTEYKPLPPFVPPPLLLNKPVFKASIVALISVFFCPGIRLPLSSYCAQINVAL